MSGKTEKRLRAENNRLRLDLEAKQRELAAHAYVAHDAVGRLAWIVALAHHATSSFRRLRWRYGFEFLRLIQALGGSPR